MGRLINPGIGELLDRLSILELKIDRYKGNTDTFKDEAYAIRKQLLPKSSKIWGPVHKELLEVNTLLWEAEDEMRGYRPPPPRQRQVRVAALCGMLIQELNDKRNLIIQAANTAAGDAYKEKGN